MTPQKWINWAMGILGVLLMWLISTVYSYNTGLNDKQSGDIRDNARAIQVNANAIKDLSTDLLKQQYETNDKLRTMNDGLSRKIEVLDNKVDELVNQKRRDNPAPLPSH